MCTAIERQMSVLSSLFWHFMTLLSHSPASVQLCLFVFKGYMWCELFFCTWLCIALMATVLLYLDDKTNNGPLNLSAEDRAALEEAEKQASESTPLLADKLGASPEPSKLAPASNDQLRRRLMSRLGVAVPPSFTPRRRALSGQTVLH
eukprot:m.80682 g.80682  ORF g.80682 m.80682 type:complete len:148 (+) comp12607_c0_seq2:1484-1927(+)